MTDPQVPDEAIEAAAKVLYDHEHARSLALNERIAEEALAAALPILRRHIADENRQLLDEALTLLADAIPDPDGAIHSTQWHQREDALAARVVRDGDT